MFVVGLCSGGILIVTKAMIRPSGSSRRYSVLMKVGVERGVRVPGCAYCHTNMPFAPVLPV